jgi:hypothetical protein
VASGKRITKLVDGPLLGARDLLGPGAQAGAECIRPLIHHLEDDATAFPSNQDFALSREPTLLREPDRLTATILEELRASRFHCASLDACLYVVKLALRFQGERRAQGVPKRAVLFGTMSVANLVATAARDRQSAGLGDGFDERRLAGAILPDEVRDGSLER